MYKVFVVVVDTCDETTKDERVLMNRFKNSLYGLDFCHHG
jgi:hypothetical protein